MNNTDHPIFRIALFGKGDSLWSVASLLCKNLPDYVRFFIIEDKNSAGVVAASTLAYENEFNRKIGISFEDLFKHSNGTLGLGTDCVDWSETGSHFFASPSGLLPTVNNVRLHQIVLRAAYMRGEPEKFAHLYQPFRFCARTAEAGKFSFCTKSSQSPTAMLGPTVQFDRAGFAAMLRKRFKSAGAEISEGRPVEFIQFDDSRHIHSVQLDNGKNIAADFFVDVSGKLSGIVADNRQTTNRELASLLPFDSKISCYHQEGSKARNNHTTTQMLQSGLLIKTPLHDGSISEFLFSAKDANDEMVSQFTNGGTDILPFEVGFTDTPWTGNLVRLGSASATLGPYFSADQLLLHAQVQKLLDLIPTQSQMNIEASVFNTEQKTFLDEIRDFVLLPFVLNDRTDLPWKVTDCPEVPESLQIRIDQFRSRGRFVPYEREVFDQQLWIDMMIGLGVVPERYDPMARSIDLREVLPILRRMVDDFTQIINAMPDHDDFFESHVQQFR